MESLRRDITEKFTKQKDLQDTKSLFMPLLKDGNGDYTETEKRDNNMTDMLKNVPM